MKRYVMGCNRWILNVASKWVFTTLLFTLLLTPLTPLFAQNLPTGPSGMPSVDAYVDQLDASGGSGPSIDTTTGGGSSVPAGPSGMPSVDAFAAQESNMTINQVQQTPAPAPANTQTLVPTGTVDSWVYKVSVTVAGWILQAGGYVFDTGFKMFVMDLGCWYVKDCGGDKTGNGEIGAVVNEVWEIVRDFFNILFIFTLIYIGIRTILFSEDTGTRKLLGGLIAAALLINFSLYIAKVVVDISNFTAVQIADSITITRDFRLEPNISESGGEQVEYGPSIHLDNDTIAGSFMSVLEFSSFFSTGTSASQFILYSLMLLFFSVILAFTFAYAGFMLLGRFIAITFYLIFSPLMFLGFILPEFKSLGTKWWKGFVGYCLYAPVFVFLMYVTLFTLASMESSFTSEGYGSAFSGEYSTSMFSIFIFFAIGIGFIITSTKLADAIAKQTGAIGISTASKWGKKATFGAAAWTGGRAATSALGGLGKRVENFSNRMPGGLGGSHVRSWGENLQKKNIGGSSSYKERKDATEEHNKKRTQSRLDTNLQSTITAGTARGAQPPQRTAMETALRDASPPQIVTLAQSSSGIAALEAAARTGSIPQNKIDAVINSKDVNETNRQRLREAAEQGARNRMNNNQNGIAGLASGDLTTLDFEQDILPNAMNLSSSQMQSLRNAWQQNQTQSLQRLEVERENQFNEAIRDNRYNDIVDNRSDSEIAQLPNDVISNPGFVVYLARNNRISNRMLTQIATRPGTINTSSIGNTLRQYYTNPNNNVNVPQDVQNFFNSAMGGQFQ